VITVWGIPIELSGDPGSIPCVPLRFGETMQKLPEEPGSSGQGIHELADEGIS